MANSVGDPVQSCPFKEKEEKKESKAIKFKISDKDESAPVENVSILIEKPDGNFEIKDSNDKGEVEFSMAESGECKLHIDWRVAIYSRIPLSRMVLIQ